jgi:hypothetical protein
MSGTLSTGPGGGIVPPGQGGVGNPMEQQMVQRMAQVPTEQLQEMAARAGNSPQGQMAQRLLQQRHMMPNAGQPQPQQTPSGGGITAPTGNNSMQPGTGIAQTPQATAAGVSLPPTTNAMQRGGGIASMVHPSPTASVMAHAPQPPRQHFDMGGMPASQESPWWAKSDARGETGLIHAYSPGRTDTINMEPLAGSYVIPADVISGLGEGNTLAGAATMDRVLNSGPGGIPMPRGHEGRGPPEPARQPTPIYKASGGTIGDGRVPIIAAGGEYTVSPEQVQALGRGDMKRGHDLLDKFVLEIRRRTIKDLRKLPPPKKK